DLLEDLAAVLARQIEVEQDQVGAGSVDELALTAQETESFDAVGNHVQPVAHLVFLERLLGHQDVAGVVLDQQHLDGLHQHDLAQPCRPLISSGKAASPSDMPGTAPESVFRVSAEVSSASPSKATGK